MGEAGVAGGGGGYFSAASWVTAIPAVKERAIRSVRCKSRTIE